MRRREFIAGLGSAVAWPLAARAQQSRNLPTIGYMGVATRAATSRFTAEFQDRLRDLGWIEGRNVFVVYRWTEGRAELMAAIAAEFVKLQVDVIVTGTTPAILAAMRATSVIPIVFAAVADPVGAGLVSNLARPGGNVTGLSSQTSELAGKRLQLLLEVVPGLRRVAIMINIGNPGNVLEMQQSRAAAGALGLDVVSLEIRSAEGSGPALQALKTMPMRSTSPVMDSNFQSPQD
jgi:putative ABC transport system substrate-binding protein